MNVLRKRWFLSGALALGVSALAVAWYAHATAEEAAPTAAARPTVRVAPVVADAAAGTLARRGVVRDAQEVYVAPKAQGRVVRLAVDAGDRVRKGQVLAVIDGAELWAQTRVARSGAASAQEMVRETKRYFDAQIAQAKKARRLAHDAYRDAKASGDSAQIAAARAQYELAKKAYDVARAGRSMQVDMARGQRDVARAQLAGAQTMAANTVVRAPFSGIIVRRMVTVGDLVSPERPLFVLIHGAHKEVALDVPAAALAAVRVGQSVTVTREDGVREEGTVRTVSSVAEAQTRKGHVTVRLAADTAFAIGDDVTVALPRATAADDDAVAVPRQALVPVYHDMQVFVVDGDGVAHARLVRVVDDAGAVVRVRGDVHAGDQVVTEGQHRITDGTAVTIVKD